MTQERVRASDAEREQTVASLRAAVGEGRLTLGEGDERMARAYAATYRDELMPLMVDLPGAAGPSPWSGAPGNQQFRGRRPGQYGPPGWWGWRAAILPTWLVIVALILVLSLVPGHHFFWPLILLAFIGLRIAGFWGWRSRWRRRR